MKRQRVKTLKRSLFKHLLFLSVAMVLVFGTLMSVILYYSGVNNAYAIIRNKNQANTNYIQGYFTPLRSAVQFLAGKPEVIQAVEGPSLQKDKALSLFKTLKNSLPNINYIYSGYEDGTLLINNYTPPKGYDPRKRPWYRAALKTAPEISGGIPYREAKTREWLVSFSKVLTDDNGMLHGVIAIDTSIDAVTKILSKRDPAYSSSYSFVVDEEGTVLIHHREDLLGKQFNQVVDSEVDFSVPAGRSSYIFEQKSKIAYHTRLKSLGWIVVTVVNKYEILEFVMVRILISIAVVIALSLLVGQIISRMLSNNIIAPLQTLEKRVKAAVSGSPQTGYNDQTSLPAIPQYSELNSIANDIEQLTQQAMFRKNQELQAKNKLLERLSETDALTGLLNRRKIYEDLENEHQRAMRYASTFSIIIFDIDWFKNINDTYGHHAGDRVLKELAHLVKAMLRTSDSLGRWGGEEFLILCPDTPLEAAGAVAQRINAAVGQHRFSVSGKITISAGICEYRSGISLEDLLVEADRKLYEAKAKGKNRVVF
ncbi:MAG: sensor domain-containing diguanylate cyclase [Desulfobacteraceae bacterium]|nr:sensor domain-containing diguanylate cyclase [Desulfobacteraceae bacterium]